MRSTPLQCSEYCDGEIYDIHAPGRQELKEAITTELWLNLSPQTRDYWLAIMQSDLVRFVGTVISRSRCQIEITIRFRERHAVHGYMESFCITLQQFNRFRSLCDCHRN